MPKKVTLSIITETARAALAGLDYAQKRTSEPVRVFDAAAARREKWLNKCIQIGLMDYTEWPEGTMEKLNADTEARLVAAIAGALKPALDATPTAADSEDDPFPGGPDDEC